MPPIKLYQPFILGVETVIDLTYCGVCEYIEKRKNIRLNINMFGPLPEMTSVLPLSNIFDIFNATKLSDNSSKSKLQSNKIRDPFISIVNEFGFVRTILTHVAYLGLLNLPVLKSYKINLLVWKDSLSATPTLCGQAVGGNESVVFIQINVFNQFSHDSFMFAP